jgi:hypothetical protein
VELIKRLTLPAPRRASYPTHDRLYADRPWVVADVAECLEGGGWFKQGLHEFADREAAKLAGCV